MFLCRVRNRSFGPKQPPLLPACPDFQVSVPRAYYLYPLTVHRAMARRCGPAKRIDHCPCQPHGGREAFIVLRIIMAHLGGDINRRELRCVPPRRRYTRYVPPSSFHSFRTRLPRREEGRYLSPRRFGHPVIMRLRRGCRISIIRATLPNPLRS